MTIWIAVSAIILPGIYVCLMLWPKRLTKKDFISIILVEYIFCLFYFAVIHRSGNTDVLPQTTFFWGYNNPPKTIFFDNFLNIIVFLPVGFLTCMLSKNFLIAKALFLGLFVSETIECSQLIFKKGTFDVDDLLNNTLGAVLGSILYILFMVIVRIYHKLFVLHNCESDLVRNEYLDV